MPTGCCVPICKNSYLKNKRYQEKSGRSRHSFSQGQSFSQPAGEFESSQESLSQSMLTQNSNQGRKKPARSDFSNDNSASHATEFRNFLTEMKLKQDNEVLTNIESEMKNWSKYQKDILKEFELIKDQNSQDVKNMMALTSKNNITGFTVQNNMNDMFEEMLSDIRNVDTKVTCIEDLKKTLSEVLDQVKGVSNLNSENNASTASFKESIEMELNAINRKLDEHNDKHAKLSKCTTKIKQKLLDFNITITETMKTLSNVSIQQEIDNIAKKIDAYFLKQVDQLEHIKLYILSEFGKIKNTSEQLSRSEPINMKLDEVRQDILKEIQASTDVSTQSPVARIKPCWFQSPEEQKVRDVESNSSLGFSVKLELTNDAADEKNEQFFGHANSNICPPPIPLECTETKAKITKKFFQRNFGERLREIIAKQSLKKRNQATAMCLKQTKICKHDSKESEMNSQFHRYGKVTEMRANPWQSPESDCFDFDLFFSDEEKKPVQDLIKFRKKMHSQSSNNLPLDLSK
ncbi:hypothetical protein GQR58_000722 [Nymphon striatum]|nr:hypothetical protein GQR58_000722 [Nymphon striatum]